MSLIIEIPENVEQAICVPQAEREGRTRLELACALYRQELLSFGLAAELAGMSKFLFGHALTERGIPRHYSDADVAADFAYARGQ